MNDYGRYKNRLHGIGIRIVETGEIFETRTAYANYLGVSAGAITYHLSGKSKTCGGYHLEIVDILLDHELTEEILEELYELTGETCEWRSHPDRPNVYVSYNGTIAKNVRGRIIIKQQNVINSGYLVASIGDLSTVTSKNHNVLVHKLVAETYVYNDDPINKRFVNHIDGDKFNNSANNLEWCSASENMRHAFDNGLCPTERVLVVETGEIFNSMSDCARAIGGTVSGIHDCKSGRQTHHRGYHFRFLGGDYRCR